MTVFLLDTTILAVYDEFRSLILCDFSPGLNSFFLGIVNTCGPIIPFTFDGPSVRVWNNVLWFTLAHFLSPEI